MSLLNLQKAFDLNEQEKVFLYGVPPELVEQDAQGDGPPRAVVNRPKKGQD